MTFSEAVALSNRFAYLKYKEGEVGIDKIEGKELEEIQAKIVKALMLLEAKI